ncbi:NeuD/PglB/VioB family sugar acetyltransferase [Aquirufa aurantiipilula]|uniref:NeuD/PglB/VioB family sugar acetyltransferase n=1 Tax=Aquirufa aurantiipilula TaxID=2696561 RepID=UPI001CAA77DD|nr:NeuD/PglB/VioB family sugar acetyltransferase [Aquirufa aurantiipilula]MBZ1326604.1 acetyltransferase [Aquirufa aurantiipilula]
MLDKQKKGIVLIGGGGHCKSVIDIIEDNHEFRIEGIIDVKEKIGSNLFGIPFIGTDQEIPSLVKRYTYFHISLGHILSNVNRVRIFQLVSELGGEFPIIKANDAYVSTFASIKAGTFIGHKAVINAGAQIGLNNIINTGAIIEHDSIIGDNCHISTMATVNADCEIGDSTFLSSHAVINRGIKIPEQSIVYSGAVVTKTFIGFGLALRGIPAQIIS